MKRYYSETIPTELGIKLQDAGMPIDWQRDGDDEYPLCPNVGCLTMYGEVLDWMMEKDKRVYVVRDKKWNQWRFIVNTENSVRYYDTWFEAANTGIETALKMLKEGKK